LRPLYTYVDRVDAGDATVSAGLFAYHARGERVWHFWRRHTQKLVRRGEGWVIARLALVGIAADPPGDPALFTGRPDRRPVVGP
jgi:hypothetical protein